MSSYFGSFGGGSSNPYGSTRRLRFERDLARARARQARIAKLNLREQGRDRDDTWFADALIPDVVEKGVDQIATSLINTPAGLYEMGKGFALDARDFATRGDLTPERTGGMFRMMGQQVYEDFRHPLRNPGYLAMDQIGRAHV